MLAATAEVTALQPLTLKVSSGITITISDASALTLERWQPVELNAVVVGDRIIAEVQEAEGRTIATRIQVSVREARGMGGRGPTRMR